MKLSEREITIAAPSLDGQLFDTLRRLCRRPGETPVRFAVTGDAARQWHCELGVTDRDSEADIFAFRPRPWENTGTFTAVLLIPTGIGCESGGHSGDGAPVARLLGGACDTLITHPNVVNASDINEMPANGLYVEGSVIARLLQGTCALRPVRSNRILTIMDHRDDPLLNAPTINAISAARTSMGVDCIDVIELDPPFGMSSSYASSGRATGEVGNLQGLFDALDRCQHHYDAFALASVVEMDVELYHRYIASEGGMTNPWGGVEAMLTHAVSLRYNKPSAHAPMIDDLEMLCLASDVVEPRLAAEEISSAFIHCVLKGLHQSPAIVTAPELLNEPGLIGARDISCLVIPDHCIGLPTLAAMLQGIPVIAVKSNRNLMVNDLSKLPFRPGQLIYAENYLEAAGMMTALKNGVPLRSLQRPAPATRILR